MHPLLNKYVVFVVDRTNDPYLKEGERKIWKTIIRFTKETKTQLIAVYDRDCIYEGKNKDKYEVSITKKFLKRSDGTLKLIYDKAWNEGVNFYIEEIDSLKCSKTFEDLFQTDIFSNKFVLSDRQLKMISRKSDRDCKIGLYYKDLYSNPLTLEHDVETSSYCKIENKEEAEKMKGNPFYGIDEWDAEIVRHLEELFNLPVYRYNSISIEKPDMTDGTDSLGKEMIIYRTTHFGDDKKYITFEENYFNRKMYLWIFEDRLVYMLES